MRTETQKVLARRLVGAMVLAFLVSMALTWMLHERMTKHTLHRHFDKVFNDVAVDIRERVDSRMLRQAMIVRDMIYEMREEAWWNDPDESSRRLRALADELGVDEICIADDKGMLTHSARREEVGALDFTTAEGQAREFAALLRDKFELAQPLLPNTLRGDMVKYVGVWIPDGGFVQVGGCDQSVRNLARTAVTGLSHGWHVSGDDGGIFITTGNGTIISHPEAGHEGGQWMSPGEDSYWEKRVIEGFPVYIVVPKQTAIVERRVLVVTSALLNGAALIFAAILGGIVISRFVHERMRERNAKDMAMAASIQESAIPRVFPPFPDERRMDLFASMHPAKDVGGDFYDFYITGSGRLFFLVADVSGKGVPAALFMMRARATIKGIAQTGLSIDEVAARANDSLARDNDANMFVTAWLGEINLGSGEVTYVNAGHNPPLLVERNSGAYAPKFERERSGMMFGAMPGMKYRSHTLKLAPGDMLYLYTDGLTEQPDEKEELFGEERLAFSLGEMLSAGTKAFDGASSPLLSALFAAVIAHGAGTEQADDCTQLVLRYNGERRTKAFEPTQDGMAAVSEWLDGVLGDFRAETLGAALHVIVDEICSNIVRHSGATGFEVSVEPVPDPFRVRMSFSDDGVAYDPLAHADPDTTLSAAERPIGGLGILMVKKMSDAVSYSRSGDRNILTIEKRAVSATATTA